VQLPAPLAIMLRIFQRFALRLSGASSFSSHDIVRDSSSLSTLHFAQLSWVAGRAGMLVLFSLLNLSIEQSYVS